MKWGLYIQSNVEDTNYLALCVLLVRNESYSRLVESTHDVYIQRHNSGRMFCRKYVYFGPVKFPSMKFKILLKTHLIAISRIHCGFWSAQNLKLCVLMPPWFVKVNSSVKKKLKNKFLSWWFCCNANLEN